MCGRFIQQSPEVYARYFDVDAPAAAQPRYNIAPTQLVLAVRVTKDSTRELVPLRWGLVPSWSSGPDSRFSMINACAETVATKPAYRRAFAHRRCLIPSEGFYEWKAGERGKTPYLIRRTDGEPFGMAGLWEVWRKEDGTTLESCTIIVTEANTLVRELHDRMPVVLERVDYAAWLDPHTPADRLRAMLPPADPSPWTLRQVSRKVNSPKYDSPDLLEPVTPS